MLFETPQLFAPMNVIHTEAIFCLYLKAYAEKRMLNFFVLCCQLDYVGSKENVESMRAVTEIYKQISALYQKFRDPKSGHCFILTTDKLHDKYL